MKFGTAFIIHNNNVESEMLKILVTYEDGTTETIYLDQDEKIASWKRSFLTNYEIISYTPRG